jgi:hypothetical protein
LTGPRIFGIAIDDAAAVVGTIVVVAVGAVDGVDVFGVVVVVVVVGVDLDVDVVVVVVVVVVILGIVTVVEGFDEEDLVWCEGEEEDVIVGIVSGVEGFDEDL